MGIKLPVRGAGARGGRRGGRYAGDVVDVVDVAGGGAFDFWIGGDSGMFERGISFFIFLMLYIQPRFFEVGFFSVQPDRRHKFAGMIWLKDIDVYKPYSDSLYFTSALLARQTERLAREIWAPSGLPPSHAHLLLEKLEQDGFIWRANYEQLVVIKPTEKAWKLFDVLLDCQRTFSDQCNRLLGKRNASNLASMMDEAAETLRAREGCA